MGPKYLSIKAIGFQVVKTSITSLTCLCVGGHLHKWIKMITVLRSGGEHWGQRYYLNDTEWNQWLLQIKWKDRYAFESYMCLCKFVLSVRSYIRTMIQWPCQPMSGSQKLDENTIHILYLHCLSMRWKWKHVWHWICHITYDNMKMYDIVL